MGKADPVTIGKKWNVSVKWVVVNYIKRSSETSCSVRLFYASFRLLGNMQGRCCLGGTTFNCSVMRLVSVPARYSQFNQSGCVLLLCQSVPSGKLGWTSHHYDDPAVKGRRNQPWPEHRTRPWVRNVRQTATIDALQLEHGKLWAKQCGRLCQMPFILARGHFLLSFIWEKNVLMTENLRLQLEFAWWAIEPIYTFFQSVTGGTGMTCIQRIKEHNSYKGVHGT